MAMQIQQNVNMNGWMITNAAFETLASEPTNPSINQIYIDSINKVLKMFDGIKWNVIGVASAMDYKGTIGVGGTVSALPTTVDDTKNGDTYVVCSAGEYNSIYAKPGDMFIANKKTVGASIIITWDLVPSGNDKFVTTITGNGATTEFAIPHTLNTKDVTVEMYEVATNEKVIADVEHTADNVVTIKFANPPSISDSYRVIIVG